MAKCMTCREKSQALPFGAWILRGFCSVECLFAYPSVEAIFQALRREKALFFFFPSIPNNALSQGQQMGQGGTNSVYRVNETPRFLIKDAGSGGREDSREYRSLMEMEAIGLKTVVKGLHRNAGKLMLVMESVSGGTDSKSIIGYQRTLKDYVDTKKSAPAPNPQLTRFVTKKSIEQLMLCWGQMVLHEKSFGDFQFMLNAEGDVFLNDPTNVENRKPSNTIQVIIQAFIDTWEYKAFQLYFEMDFTWREFKLAKEKIIKRIQSSFYLEFAKAVKLHKGEKLKPIAPAFKMLSHDFFAPAFFESTLFVLKADLLLDGFCCIKLGDDSYGYYSEQWG
ncbi:hypothetical protein OV208_12195 [Corallococcus sp. bb12-1]|uniref:hypothetical protein n=1 Tax=Corallococcus sp. bb12-1 TaxID=2996784 RepID=UPI002270A1BB|nr:hypothetical protein [Corallococcus sp. bb12-1]MCY1042078.1 hypothetical protein [Corallococcus sp. bb12-1]